MNFIFSYFCFWKIYFQSPNERTFCFSSIPDFTLQTLDSQQQIFWEKSWIPRKNIIQFVTRNIYLFIDIVLSRYSEKLLKTTNQNRLPPPFTFWPYYYPYSYKISLISWQRSKKTKKRMVKHQTFINFFQFHQKFFTQSFSCIF